MKPDQPAAHTPGPWRVLEWADEKKGFTAIVDSSQPRQHVADIFPFGKRAAGIAFAEHQANARLIAAAPEMKERGNLLALCARDFLDEQTDINAERLALAVEGWNAVKATGSNDEQSRE